MERKGFETGGVSGEPRGEIITWPGCRIGFLGTAGVVFASIGL